MSDIVAWIALFVAALALFVAAVALNQIARHTQSNRRA